MTASYPVDRHFLLLCLLLGFFCGWPKYMSLCRPRGSTACTRKGTLQKMLRHNNHLPDIVKKGASNARTLVQTSGFFSFYKPLIIYEVENLDDLFFLWFF